MYPTAELVRTAMTDRGFSCGRLCELSAWGAKTLRDARCSLARTLVRRPVAVGEQQSGPCRWDRSVWHTTKRKHLGDTHDRRGARQAEARLLASPQM